MEVGQFGVVGANVLKLVAMENSTVDGTVTILGQDMEERSVLESA